MAQRIRIAIPKTTMTYIVILAVAVVGAVMREINLLIILAGMMSGPLLISRAMIRSTLRDLKVKRKVPRSVFLGAPCRIEVSIENPRRRTDSWALVIEDQLQNTTHRRREKRSARAFLPHVARGQTGTARYEARLWTRGRYHLGPLQLTTKVPVGLLQGRCQFLHRDEVVVYPKLGELLEGWSTFSRFEHTGKQSSRRRQGPVSGDFYGLRDWRSGDNRRWIHWRSSAKRNQLVVRQYEQQQNHDLMLLLDLTWPDDAPGRSNSKTPVDDLTVERTISFVATLVAQHCSRGAGQLTLCVDGNHRLQVRGPASTGVMNDALEVLAELDVQARTQTPDQVDAQDLPSTDFSKLPPLAGEDHVIAVSIGRFDWNRWIDPRDPTSSNYPSQAIAVDVTDGSLDRFFHVEGIDLSPQTDVATQNERNGSSPLVATTPSNTSSRGVER